MANEYMVNIADLTSVANAIRAKNKTNDYLMFPDGFVSAIQAGGGADLNFEVVGGTTQPSNPKENTIWVNTNAEITGWIFSVEEPDTPTSGMIWIKVGVVSDTSFNALKENSFLVYPLYASQYINNAFEVAPTKIYYTGTWFHLMRIRHSCSITVDNHTRGRQEHGVFKLLILLAIRQMLL